MNIQVSSTAVSEWLDWGAANSELLGTIGVNSADEFARLCWNTIIEPGDSLATFMIDTFGPRGALVALGELGDQAHRGAGRIEPPDDLNARSDDILPALERWGPRLADVDRVARVAKSTASLRISALTPECAIWPDEFSRLGAHAPIMLWTLGNQDLLGRHLVGYVGARAATNYGLEVTRQLVTELAGHGLGVVSGGAYGIDGAAHNAAGFAGAANLAVLAGGLDRLYPAGHQQLFAKIREHGLIISEVPVGTAPTRWRFLTRNRLISALSAVLVVVEAGFRSGALNSAYHALQMGVPTGAVPGPITSAMSAGCHKLIKTGEVETITSARDILDLISETLIPEDEIDRLAPTAQRVCDALTRKPISADEIALRSGCSPHEVAGALAQLHLLGKAQTDSSGWALA